MQNEKLVELLFNFSCFVGAWLPEVCTLDDVFRSQVVMLEHVVRVPVTQLRGIAAVVDCSGLSMTHAYYLTPTHIRRMISVVQVSMEDILLYELSIDMSFL